MRLLLDTHVLLWALSTPESLSAQARTAIIEPANEVLVSAASGWEVGAKAALGKLRIPADLEEQMQATRFTPLPIEIPAALAVQHLPPHHGDPFDRLLVAQAQRDRLTLVTRDEVLGRYSVMILEA